MTKLTEHIFNASYLAIFLYGMRRIMHRIRPISLEDAYSLVNGLIKRPGEPIFLVHRDGTYYHVANAPISKSPDVVMCIANSLGNSKRNQWAKVAAQHNVSITTVNVVWNTPLTKLIPTEMQNRIPILAQNLKKAYGEAV